MSGEKATNSCNKFQANIFNKSKCQNCFKSRELHLLNDHDMGQAKPIYGGWLCLAPEGTDFDNPMQRSRKWQRRFFILYEHGSLSFALDELPSTLPQGTVNMNLCTDITDAEPRTGQRNALCIITPEQEIFIRGDSKEIINGWSEQLAVYLRTNKQNQNKKRKVEPVATQEPSPAKMAATDTGFPSSECSAVSSRWQEDQLGRRPDVTSIWTVTDPPGPEQTPAGATGAKDTHTHTKTHSFMSISQSQPFPDLFHCLNILQMFTRLHLFIYTFYLTLNQTCRVLSWRGFLLFSSLNCGFSIVFSLQPDLLNFKKGWMVKLDENDQWKKYWFVLSTDSLRYYKDSVAEEASAVEGEIDLTKCYNVSEYQVQRNYGFQIHTPKAVYTLSAMTAGIRRNWIQALIKNVHPANAPDVASLPGHQIPCSPPEAFPKPDVTRDSPSADVPTDRDFHLKPRSVMERRQEGRYKTFDWAEFRPQNKLILETDPQKTEPPCLLEMGDLERRKRREERRRRYESMLGLSLGWEEIKEKTVGGRALSPTSHQKVEEEIEDCWKQVENTVFRLERTVPLYSETKDAADMENLLDSYRKWAKLSELERQLDQSELTCRDTVFASCECLLFLQATCEHGFASMEESHLKMVEELQRQHQQQVERLLMERDRLLEEESAATATAIEAIKNAHRLELERELQKRCQSESSSGNSQLQDIYRQHSEELTSYQQELEVLSQQFCLKCLENGHLVQALDAERKALCQCQQENQDLRTRNQELSGHLAAEITRLCSLAKQDDLPLSQGMDVYEMEITLRVKESEVQCLKQANASLKDELQSAQRDKRNATKKYKDMYTELSIVRAQAERKMDELRENLRLAHQALVFVCLFNRATTSHHNILYTQSQK
uniref:PH domain-containing protein n=1 Tax=Anabas testudineus TaxID=64144 RepID=A0A3Q1J570_ANATE